MYNIQLLVTIYNSRLLSLFLTYLYFKGATDENHTKTIKADHKRGADEGSPLWKRHEQGEA